MQSFFYEGDITPKLYRVITRTNNNEMIIKFGGYSEKKEVTIEILVGFSRPMLEL